jgi:biotin carboxyl carrier protein
MSNHTWKIDGSKEISSNLATVKWENNTFFTIYYKNEKFHGELVEEQLENRMIKVKINHRDFTISKDGPLDKLIEELGLNKVKIRKLNQLKSPMPGRIVGISMKVGQEIEIGSELLTLEAMKMENVLKSDGIGKVKTIEVKAGDVVDKGAVLATFE